VLLLITPDVLLLGIGALLVKHYIADYLLQTRYMLQNKGKYGHPGGIYHAAIHMAASVPVLLWLGAGLWAVLGLILLEGILHYHIDWGKEQAQGKLNFGIERVEYWYLFGLDQVLHHLTYVLMLWVLLRI
jgi:hypothetical protein